MYIEFRQAFLGAGKTFQSSVDMHLTLDKLLGEAMHKLNTPAGVHKLRALDYAATSDSKNKQESDFRTQ